ncbi:dimethylarginine dimethylaminohydrolase family protein [Pontibacter silvestris]|uniref:arginine deiminase n=1 Tax=Pontibacter silvestris TaxID=2305183 RepID=A0ABW4X2M0_9BACT|nr:arginine deiminase family protein [Pontibacter silvestris]MCC9134799.1 arginine deiminase family protein [Pontibacter silvestris]
MEALSQYNETDTLRRVIIGRYEGYRKVPAYTELVNEEQKKGLPENSLLETEFKQFRQVLNDAGVEVLVPGYVGKFVYDQLTPRDLGVAIGKRFLICNMAKKSRRYEVAGIFQFINDERSHEPNVVIPDSPTCFIEGGDIIVDKGKVWVGISQRTNEEGLDFLAATFGDEFDVIPVYAKALSEGENVLHLDCMFNPVGENNALIYSDGFREIPKEIKQTYQLIEVSQQEQQALATNVLSLSRNKVISRSHPDCKRVNNLMRQVGIEVIEINFNGAPATGGSFRCCTLPLLRTSSPTI